MDAQQQLFGLMAVAEEHQKAIQAAIDGLSAERAALAKERAALGQVVVAAVKQSLAGASETSVAAVTKAAGPFTRELQGAAQQAKAAADEVAGAARWLGLRAVGVAAGCVVVVGLAAWGQVAWQQHAMSALQSQIAQERANLADLARRGGRVKLETCGPQRRLCVQVDKSAGVFGRGADYDVLKGY